MTKMTDAVLDQLFRTARSHNAWRPEPVNPSDLEALYDLMKMGPTSANCSPARLVFVTSPEGKARLIPHMLESNRVKTETAPVTVILAYDTQFYDRIPELFPHMPSARDWFAHDVQVARDTALRNGSLQGGYLMLAARALGLDVGPMSGFDADGVNATFFPDGRFAVNFICNLGYGDPAGLFERSPRLSFADACQLV